MEMNWISVKDRLPENYISVLGYIPELFPFSQLKECFIGPDGEWHYAGDYSADTAYITHWMPLPEPPED